LTDIDSKVWDNIDYYYTEIRCDFYHQSAGKTLTDTDLLDYQETVEFVIDRAFGIRMADLVKAEIEAVQLAKATTPGGEAEFSIRFDEIRNDTDKILAGVSQVSPSSVVEINDFFRKQGINFKLKSDEFTNIVARNSGTKKFFFFNKQLRRWELSALGKFRLEKLVKGETDER
jgi:hypothetical protein